MKTEMINLVEDDKTKAGRRVDFLKRHDDEISRVIQGFTGVPGYISLRMDWACCLDLNYTGDIEVLKAVFHAFRTLGYSPTARPEDPNEPTFSTYFKHPDHPEMKWWFFFTSTSCKRVKIGTKMQEVDIYETQCVTDIVEVEILPGYDGEPDLLEVN